MKRRRREEWEWLHLHQTVYSYQKSSLLAPSEQISAQISISEAVLEVAHDAQEHLSDEKQAVA